MVVKMDNFELYKEFIKIKLNSMLQYKSAFIWTSISKISVWGTEFLMIWIMIEQFKNIGPWSSYEVLLLFALNLTSYSLAGFFFFGVADSLPGMIKSGEFDEILTKPLNSLLYLICKEFNTTYFSNISVSVAVLIVCMAKLNIKADIINVSFLLVTIISGSFIQGAAFIFSSVPAFWLIENRSLRYILGDIRGFIRYPVSIYNKIIQVILIYIIPYAFISFFPSQFILNKRDYIGFNPAIQFISPFIGVFTFILAYKFWNIGIKHYNSTGS